MMTKFGLKGLAAWFGLCLVAALTGLQANELTTAKTDEEEAPFKEVVRIRGADAGVGRLMPDVEFTDIEGRKRRLSDLKSEAATVVAVTSTSCPMCKRFLPTLAELERTYSDKGVTFLFVNPTSSDTDKSIREAIATHNLRGPYVRDPDGVLLAPLGCHTTTDCFVLDPVRTLVYRGAVDDQYGIGHALDAPRHRFLIAALESTLAANPVEIQATYAPGCAVEFEKSVKAVGNLTYHNRISRIMQSNCVRCHREEGDAPFSLSTYEDVIGHAPMIRKVVEQGIMPPWFVAKSSAPSPWSNDCSLTEVDKADLMAWLKSSRPLGNPAEAVTPLKYPKANSWHIGTPDIVLKLPKPVLVKATGAMPYQYAIINTRYDQDLWVQAAEIRPTVKGVLHHVLVFMEKTAWHDNGLADERRGFLVTYAPGNTHQIYPEGFAKRLPKDISLRFQLHYAPNGKAAEEQMEIGLLLAKSPPLHEIHGYGIANNQLRIPANAPNHSEFATKKFPMDIELLTLMPHLHSRGKAFRYELVSSDGVGRRLLDVDRFDYKWQLGYYYSKPVPVPKGTAIKATGWFDNSAKNPRNPDSSKIVRWGPQTYDEMLIGYVEYFVPGVTPTVADPDEPTIATPKRDTSTVAQPVSATDSRKTLDLFKVFDKDGDGRLSLAECRETGSNSITGKLNKDSVDRTFERLDVNEDNFVSLEEFSAFISR